MSAEEIRHRFRLALIGYVLLAAFFIAGLWLDHDQTQSIKHTQDALTHDTTALAREIADGQVYLCDLIATLEAKLGADLHVYCVTQQQRYQQIISQLESH